MRVCRRVKHFVTKLQTVGKSEFSMTNSIALTHKFGCFFPSEKELSWEHSKYFWPLKQLYSFIFSPWMTRLIEWEKHSERHWFWRNSAQIKFHLWRKIFSSENFTSGSFPHENMELTGNSHKTAHICKLSARKYGTHWKLRRQNVGFCFLFGAK